MAYYKGTSSVVFDKSKIAAQQINSILNTAPPCIRFEDTETQFIVFDKYNLHPQYMAKVVDMLIQSVKQK